MSAYQYAGILGKLAFAADMSAAGLSPDDIELQWVERTYGYGSEKYVAVRLAKQMGISEDDARDALWSFQVCCGGEGQTVH
jgi:hypothetical protein